jgi:hypothetical protein
MYATFTTQKKKKTAPEGNLLSDKFLLIGEFMTTKNCYKNQAIGIL